MQQDYANATQALLILLLLFWAMARTLRMAFAAAKADAR